MRLSMRRHWYFLAPAALVGIVLVGFIGGEAVKLLWNWLVPPIIGWREITFWQAFGLLALCRILFGGHQWHKSGRSDMRERLRDRAADRMADRVAERWEHMTSEERERFRQRLRDRCGFDPAAGESAAAH
jgi:hypothetical protein